MSLRFLYDNLGDRLTPTVTTEDASFPARNLFDGRRSTAWKGTSTAIHYVRFDAGAAVGIDYIAIARADLLVDAGATVVAQYSTDDFAADINDAFTPVALSSGSLFATAGEDWFASFAKQTKRYWRVKLSGMTSVPSMVGLWIGAQSSAFDGLDDPAELGPLRTLRGTDLRGGFSGLTPALAAELATYIAAVTPGFPAEPVVETASGAVQGAVPHWIYNDDGSHFRKTGTPVLVNVQLMTPDPPIAVRSFNRHEVSDLRWREVR